MSPPEKTSPASADGVTATHNDTPATHGVETELTTLEAANDPDNLKDGDLLANPEEQIEALGIPNWRDLEKQVVKRLDMTLMPCLWVLYLFNYLDRASIA